MVFFLAESLIDIQSEHGKHIIDGLRYNKSETFPSAENLAGAVDALLRLQDTYRLETSSLAKGLFATAHSTTVIHEELTASDCFELGRRSYVNNDFYHTILWMREALDRCEEEGESESMKIEILDYLAFAHYKQNNIFEALRLTNEILRIQPNHERAKGNKVFYEDWIGHNTKSKLRGDDGDALVPLDNTVTTRTETLD